MENVYARNPGNLEGSFQTKDDAKNIAHTLANWLELNVSAKKLVDVVRSYRLHKVQ